MAHLRTASRAATLMPPPSAVLPATTRKRAPGELTIAQLDALERRAGHAMNQVPPTTCEACGGRMKPLAKLKRKGDGDRYYPHCKHCRGMFGIGVSCPETTDSPEQVLAKLEGVRVQGYVMVLRPLTLGASNGDVVDIHAGDIFPVRHVPQAFSDNEVASRERTKAMFTLPLQLGPHQTYLRGHEFAPISLSRVMEMRRRGEISESFITSEDNVGHFTPKVDLIDTADTIAESVGAMPAAIANAIRDGVLGAGGA